MKPRALLCLALWLVVVGHAGAQTPTAPPELRPMLPPGPILATTPDLAAWTIVLQTTPGLPGQSAEAVVRGAAASVASDSVISVTKTGQVRHWSRRLKGGQQEDVWYEQGNRITTQTGWKIPMFEAAAAPAGQPRGPDFPELTWIAAKNFVGTQHHQDTDYFVFEAQLASQDHGAMAGEEGRPLTALNRAYVNAETRLPWLLQTGDVLHRYVFQAPPTVPLEVPPEVQAMFDTFERNKKAESSRKPVAP